MIGDRSNFKLAATILMAVVLFGSVEKSSASPAAVDWYAILRISEQQLAQKKFVEGTTNYIKALQSAESARVLCGSERFVELMAVGSEIVTRGAKPLEPTSPPSVSTDNKLIETALKWKEHTALAICGKTSPAVIDAWQSLSVYYGVVLNEPLATEYHNKCLAPGAAEKFRDAELYGKAGAARSNAYISNEFNSIKRLVDAANKGKP